MPVLKEYPHAAGKTSFQKDACETRRNNVRRVPKRKSISFCTQSNLVRLLKVPPKTENKNFWFTTKRRDYRKGVFFSLHPGHPQAVQVDYRMQLCTIAKSTRPRGSAMDGKNYRAKSSGDTHSSTARKKGILSSASSRTFLTVSCLYEGAEGTFVNSTGLKSLWEVMPDPSKYLENQEKVYVGSCCPGQLQRIRVILPSGMYFLGCEGDECSLHVFGQEWDIKEELV